MKQNIELKQRLGLDQNGKVASNMTSNHCNDSIESAELISVPQQKVQESSSMKGIQKLMLPSMMPFVYLLMIMNLMKLLTCYKSVLKELNQLSMNKENPSKIQSPKVMMKLLQELQMTNWSPSKT